MKLVQFENGKYGVRAGWFFGWEFVDLKEPRFKWKRSDEHFYDCMGSKERCEQVVAQSKLKFRAVK